jgi:predicted acylesterase/phospholipase RssA/CRP-like cAMP-binding protein
MACRRVRNEQASLPERALHDRIVARVSAVRRRVREALDAFLQGSPAGSSSSNPLPVRVSDLERYLAEWEWLVPGEAADRQALLSELLDSFGSTFLDRAKLANLFRCTPGMGAETVDETASSVIDALENVAEWIAVQGGETLMREGDPSDCLYILVSGRLGAALAAGPGVERRTGEMTRGTTIGEMGVITGEPRSARVFAVRDSHLLRIGKQDFDGLTARYPELMRGAMLALISRTQRAERRAVGNTLRTIALVPLNASIELGEVGRQLTQAMSEHGTCVLVDPAMAQPHAVAGQSELLSWLNGLEEVHRFIVYAADATWSEWTALCVRQADRILVVGDERTGGELTNVEEQLRKSATARQELMLLQSGQRRGTRKWLDARQIVAHHHVRCGCAADFQRVARRLVGRGVGLVLGGGGARGFAHIGALRALHEANVPIDIIAGCSSGSIIAAQYGLGWGPDELYERNRRLALRGKRLIDYTLPVTSFIAARKFTQILGEFFGDTQIEDLSIPFWSMSANLTRAEPIIHDQGSLLVAVRASCALPGMLPPVLFNGDIIVDGGLIDTVPVEEMNVRIDGGLTLAVDVSTKVDLTEEYAFGNYLSGVQLVWNKLNPFGKRDIVAPSLAAVLLRSFELASVMNQNRGQAKASLFIEPPVRHIDRLAFEISAFEELVQLGYECARETLKSWDYQSLIRGDSVSPG